MRVLEIGCGPGAMARAIARRIGNGHILGIDRSAKAIRQAIENSSEEIVAGTLSFRQCAIEHFTLASGEKRFDLVIAVRVGALDGRHPEIEQQALKQIDGVLTKTGTIYVDGGNPLKEIQRR